MRQMIEKQMWFIYYLQGRCWKQYAPQRSNCCGPFPERAIQNIVMPFYAMDIYLCCCKSRCLSLILVTSYRRFREGLQVRTLTARGSPGVRILIVKEYTHQIGAEKESYGMLLFTEHIVGTWNRPHAQKQLTIYLMENGTRMAIQNKRICKQNG